MSRKRETFTVMDGWLCVKYETTIYDRPEKVTHYWPIGRACNFVESNPNRFGGGYEGIVGAEATSKDGGLYTWRRAAYDYVDLRLTDGGQTKPIKTTTEPVPPPKTKLETRWRYGQWEKYLKAKGWVPA